MSRQCHALLGDDAFHRQVAVSRFGAAFWARALSRPTHRVFLSMRKELQTIDRFESHLRRTGNPLWTTTEYEAFWAMEAQYCRKKYGRRFVQRHWLY